MVTVLPTPYHHHCRRQGCETSCAWLLSPYLDDYEPNYTNPSAPAVSTVIDKSVTWDPDGPMYDTPKDDDPLSDGNSDDEYPYVTERTPAATALKPSCDRKVDFLVPKPVPGVGLDCGW